MESTYKIRQVLRFLTDCELEPIMDCKTRSIMDWEDGIVPYMAKHLITSAVVNTENDDDLVYVKGYKKQEWLKDMFESDTRDDIVFETLDVDYKDIKSLNNLDVINTMRKNVLKIVHYKMYLKYLTDGRNTRKKFL